MIGSGDRCRECLPAFERLHAFGRTVVEQRKRFRREANLTGSRLTRSRLPRSHSVPGFKNVLMGPTPLTRSAMMESNGGPSSKSSIPYRCEEGTNETMRVNENGSENINQFQTTISQK